MESTDCLRRAPIPRNVILSEGLVCGLGEGSRGYGVAMGNVGPVERWCDRHGILRSPQCLHTFVALDDVFIGGRGEPAKFLPFAWLVWQYQKGTEQVNN